jgi:hypothetical protein
MRVTFAIAAGLVLVALVIALGGLAPLRPSARRP